MGNVESFLTVIRSCDSHRALGARSGVKRNPPHEHLVQVGDLIEWIDINSEGHVSKARNLGASSARADWFLFVDEDCNIPSDFFQKLLSELKEYKQIEGIDANRLIWGALYSKVNNGNLFSRAYNWIQRAWVLYSVKDIQKELFQNILGGCFLIHRELFNELKGFNENIPWAGEETEFLRRAERKNFKIKLLKKVEVDHDKHLKFTGFFRRAWFQGFAKGKYSLQVKNSPLSFIKFVRSDKFEMPKMSELFLICSFLFVMQFASLFGRIRSKVVR